MQPYFLLFLLVAINGVFGQQGVAAEDDYVWLEGESAVRSQIQPHPWYSQAIATGRLSGGAWLSHFSAEGNGTADYEVVIPRAAEWTLWARINPIQAKLAYQVGAGTWRDADLSVVADQINVANDNKPDLRFLAWVKLARIPLAAGPTTLRFRFHSDNMHHGALDCFVLAAKPFIPEGKNKPGAKLGGADPGWYAFEPGTDDFTSAAAFNLRTLNESRAGKQGPLQVKGDVITLGGGAPARFWAVNAGAPDQDEQADYLAARLAKNGFNLARFHGAVFDRSGSDPTAIDRHHLARIHYAVKAYAEQGIYVHLSTYFPLWLQLKASDGIVGGALGKHPFVALLVDQRFREVYKSWLKQVLTSPNPATGMSLATDPAVGFVELQNEDSFFFWTTTRDNVGAGIWSQMEAHFGAWAAKRYGGLSQAVAAWQGERLAGDTADALGLFGVWELTRDGYGKAGPGKQARIRDQIRCFAEWQRATYVDLRRYVREELGFKGLVTASNWTTGDVKQLGFIERWTYAGTDVIDRHGYFGGKHAGDAAEWSLRAGQTFEDKAAVLDPTTTPLGYFQYAGKPHLHSEVAWNKPNRFVADSNLLLASYGALQGVEGFCLFATASGAWLGDGGAKWQFNMPAVFGQSPAAALQFRRGDLTPGPVALRQVVTTEDVFGLRASGVVEGPNADFRQSAAPRTALDTTTENFDPLTYFVGRVERAVDDPAAKAEALDLARYIDRTTQVVRSATRQLSWNWGLGVVTVNAPRSQAVTGFLSRAGAVQLGDVSIESANEYGTIHVISLDGQPLATAKRMLIQAFTEEKLSGWQTDHGIIRDVGHAPIQIRNVQASVVFATATGLQATALDGHGYPVGPVPVSGRRLVLPPDALYVLVTR